MRQIWVHECHYLRITDYGRTDEFARGTRSPEAYGGLGRERVFLLSYGGLESTVTHFEVITNSGLRWS